ncbi:MAG: HD-GYP domain-containing protein [Bacillota bacterium]|nr:HD-GYP domain-containing protein [Bacillota bacterium]
MRYVPLSFIQEGMILGKTLYGSMGEVLLRKGTPILKLYVRRMEKLGYTGVYIQDELSQDIEVQDVINEDLRMQTIKTVKNFMHLSTESSKGVQEAFSDIENLIGSIIEDISNNKDLIVNLIDLKVASNYTFYHSVNVSVLSIVMGVALNLPPKDLYYLGLASLLHDIGKIFTPKEILDKPGTLTKEEFEIIQQHAQNGYTYIKEKFTTHAKTYVGILQHHERFDGTGYPEGKKGKDISLFGRIIAITDVYDALTSDRTYRKGVLPSEGMEYIMGAGGTLFDPDLVKVFVSKIAPYPVGTCVQLSNGLVGIVAENNFSYFLRPKVKIIRNNNDYVEPYIMDLKESNLNVTIVGVADVLKQDITLNAV